MKINEWLQSWSQAHKEMYPTYGTFVWYRRNTWHRDDNKPAMTMLDGTKKWYQNGKLHREDGPAIEYGNGEKHWYLNGKLHRKDGPAIEYVDGLNMWFINGERQSPLMYKLKRFLKLIR